MLSHRQDRFVTEIQYLELTPSDFGDLLAHTDNAFSPIQGGVGIAALVRCVHMLIAIRTIIDDWHHWLFVFSKSGVRFPRPLHWRAAACPLRQVKIIRPYQARRHIVRPAFLAT